MHQRTTPGSLRSSPTWEGLHEWLREAIQKLLQAALEAEVSELLGRVKWSCPDFVDTLRLRGKSLREGVHDAEEQTSISTGIPGGSGAPGPDFGPADRADCSGAGGSLGDPQRLGEAGGAGRGAAE